MSVEIRSLKIHDTVELYVNQLGTISNHPASSILIIKAKIAYISIGRNNIAVGWNKWPSELSDQAKYSAPDVYNGYEYVYLHLLKADEIIRVVQTLTSPNTKCRSCKLEAPHLNAECIDYMCINCLLLRDF